MKIVYPVVATGIEVTFPDYRKGQKVIMRIRQGASSYTPITESGALVDESGNTLVDESGNRLIHTD